MKRSDSAANPRSTAPSRECQRACERACERACQRKCQRECHPQRLLLASVASVALDGFSIMARLLWPRMASPVACPMPSDGLAKCHELLLRSGGAARPLHASESARAVSGATLQVPRDRAAPRPPIRHPEDLREPNRTTARTRAPVPVTPQSDTHHDTQSPRPL